MTDAPIERLLDARARAAMRSPIGGAEASRELLCRSLWLACAPDAVAQSGGAVLALSGFACFGPGYPRDLAAALADRLAGSMPALRLDGHYGLVYANEATGTLELHRSPDGGERLYFALLDGLLLFASSAKALLVHPGVPRALDPDVVLEELLCRQVVFGDRTAWRGIRMVLAGHVADVFRGEVTQRWAWDGLLDGLEGESRGLSSEFRAALARSVRASAAHGRAAVALSGGLDSSLIAAVAVQEFGPENVEAFTYAVDDPSHPSEAPFASRVCRSLGIRRHHIVELTARDFVHAAPELCWRSETMKDWLRADTFLLARAIKQAGFDRFFTGSGIGSHFRYFEQLEAALSCLPWPDVTLRAWKHVRWSGWSPLRRLFALHPGLIAPAGRAPAAPLHHALIALLRHNGVISDPASHVGLGLRSLLPEWMDSPRVREAIEPLRSLSLSGQLKRLTLAHTASSVDIGRAEPACRELGVLRLSPAYFGSCLPFSHVPLRVAEERARSGLRPGKLLTSLALAGALPADVLQRRKSWQQTDVPDSWCREFNEAVSRRNGAWRVSPEAMRGHLPFLRHHYNFLAQHALWHRMFLEGPPVASPPDWRGLGVDPV